MTPLVFVVGTRPEVIKIFPIMVSPIIRRYNPIFVWSGQHYDYELSKVFFEEFGDLEPDFDLNVGSDTHDVQIAKIVYGVGRILRAIGPNGIVVSVGDTNTVLGASLATIKSGWIFGHVEAGLRSFNKYMPEEINRVVTDHIANVLFAPSLQAVLNLLYEGVDPWRIYLTGNTIIDAINMFMPHVRKLEDRVLAELGVEEPYALVTIHRAENVDHVDRLANILKGLREISKELQLIFPMHSRTRKRVKEFGLHHFIENMRVIKPVGYIEFLALLNKAMMVFTDSGGVQEEAFTLGVPCITLRRNTERPETIWLGGNILVGDDPNRIVKAYKYVLEHKESIVRKIRSAKNPYGDGKASERIATILKLLIEDQDFYKKFSYNKEGEPDYRDTDYPSYSIIEGKEFEGMRIENVHEKYYGVYVTLIYDKYGEPMIPYNNVVIKKELKLRLWGPKKFIEALRGINNVCKTRRL